MALRESGLERSMRGTMFQALRERQKELRVIRLNKTIARGAETGSGGDTYPGHSQTAYDSRISLKSSRSSGGIGSSGGSGSGSSGSGSGGSGSGNDLRTGRNGHGVGDSAIRGRYAYGRGGHHNSHVYSRPRGMVHPHTHLLSQHYSLVGPESAICQRRYYYQQPPAPTNSSSHRQWCSQSRCQHTSDA